MKTPSFLDKKDKSLSNDTKKPSRQNVALQTILKRNQEQEHKQVIKSCVYFFRFNNHRVFLSHKNFLFSIAFIHSFISMKTSYLN